MGRKAYQNRREGGLRAPKIRIPPQLGRRGEPSNSCVVVCVHAG